MGFQKSTLKNQNDHEKSIFQICSRNVPGTPRVMWGGYISMISTDFGPDGSESLCGGGRGRTLKDQRLLVSYILQKSRFL